jgi:SNF2 family DNA or RNA helicase
MNAETPTPIVYVTENGTHVITPWHDGLANAVPHAREMTWQGMRMLVMPNGHLEAKVARHLNIPVPAPILTRYDWCGSTPWDIQRTTAALLTESPRAYVLSSMGTGKSRAVLYAADYLMRRGDARRMLIVAPLSTLTPVWEREAFQLMLKRKVTVLYGSREKRLKLMEDGAPVCVINHHGLKVLGQAVLDAGFDIVVLDELAVYRNKSTDLWRFATSVVNLPSTRFAWGLTGSPTPNAPTDAWAQVKLLTPARTTRTFHMFQDQTMRKVSTFRWVPRPEANAIVRAAMNPSVRYTRDDIMELPPCSYVDRTVYLDKQAVDAYKLLYAKARMLTQQGDSITAVNAGVLQSKLLQVSCGFIYTDKKTVFALPCKGRLDALEEVLAETDRKVLVLVPFLHALAGVAAHLRTKNHDLAVVHGGTSRAARDKIFTEFQTQPSPRLIVAHPQTLSHGLTLVEANVIVWYSPTQSYDVYDQACARINRPGQTSKTLIVHMMGTPVERMTYQCLRTKARMQTSLLDLFAKQEVAF